MKKTSRCLQHFIANVDRLPGSVFVRQFFRLMEIAIRVTFLQMFRHVTEKPGTELDPLLEGE